MFDCLHSTARKVVGRVLLTHWYPKGQSRGGDGQRGSHVGFAACRVVAALIAAGRAVEVIVVGRDPERLATAERVLDKWASTPPESLTMDQEAAAEMA